MSEPQPEYESTPENAEPERPRPEQPDDRQPPGPPTAEHPADPDVEPIQPSEAPEQAPLAKVVELHSERGSLTLRPNQTVLDENQKAALVAIGIDVQQDPQVVPHLRGFIHMCQAKGLDPWAREAYLIGRGRGDNRKYTMQTGIDGYRKMAASTGRFIRIADVLWTGQDDNDQSYYRDGSGVMRRVWFDQWPAERGYPGAAKVIIEHYDDANNVVRTEAVADWGMYAPFSDKYEGYGRDRHKVIDPETRKPVQELNEMWRKGYAHMLAKCAEALAHRKAFPARMSGVYTHEEMHRLDQQERTRVQAEQARTRQQAYAEVTGGPSGPILPPVTPPADASAPAGPIPVGDVAAEVVDDARQQSPAQEQQQEQAAANEVPDATKVSWLLEELDFQAEVLGTTPAALANRQVRALRKNVDAFTVDEVLAMVSGLRTLVLDRMRATYSEDDVAKYASVGSTDVVNIGILLAADGEVMPDDTDEGGDADTPHTFVDDGNGACGVCGEPPAFGDDPLHPPA